MLYVCVGRRCENNTSDISYSYYLLLLLYTTIWCVSLIIIYLILWQSCDIQCLCFFELNFCCLCVLLDFPIFERWALCRNRKKKAGVFLFYIVVVDKWFGKCTCTCTCTRTRNEWVSVGECLCETLAGYGGEREWVRVRVRVNVRCRYVGAVVVVVV